MIEHIYFSFRDFLQFTKKTAQLVWHPVLKFENLIDYKEIKGYGGTVTSSFWFYGNQSHKLAYGEEFQLTVSCHFHFKKFPFDFHECPIYFGTDVYSTDQMKFDEITVFHDYNKIAKRKEPLFIDELALPFEFELEALPIKQKFLRGGFNYNISSAGILIRLRRNSLGQLLSGYYYPTTSFAMLSMISFLINPDVVNYQNSCFFLNYFI